MTDKVAVVEAMGILRAQGEGMVRVYNILKSLVPDVPEDILRAAEIDAAGGAASLPAVDLPPPVDGEGLMAYYVRVASLLGVEPQNAVANQAALILFQGTMAGKSFQEIVTAFVAGSGSADTAGWADWRARITGG